MGNWGWFVAGFVTALLVMGVLRWLSRYFRDPMDNPYVRTENLPSQSGDTYHEWAKKVDDWNRGR